MAVSRPMRVLGCVPKPEHVLAHLDDELMRHIDEVGFVRGDLFE